MTDIFSIIERSKAPLIVNVNHFEGGEVNTHGSLETSLFSLCCIILLFDR